MLVCGLDASIGRPNSVGLGHWQSPRSGHHDAVTAGSVRTAAGAALCCSLIASSILYLRSFKDDRTGSIGWDMVVRTMEPRRPSPSQV
jgi:hypothetical protein